MADSDIEWTERVWNPVRGCALVSPGCAHCYAMGQAHRFSGKGGPYEGLTKRRASGGAVWTGEVRESQFPNPAAVTSTSSVILTAPS